MYQNAGIEKDDDSRQSLEDHAKIDEIRRFSNKKFNSSHDVMRMSYNPLLSTEAGAAHMILKSWSC